MQVSEHELTCGKIQCLSVHRYTWLKANAVGKVLDVGTQDGSGWKMPPDFQPIEITYFDCDVWLGPKPFVRGEAAHLPFIDESFDTVVLSDILEHVPSDPIDLLLEAKRVTKYKVLVTVPDEYAWHKSLSPFKTREEWIEEAGSYKEFIRRATIGSQYAKCVRYIDDRKLPHIHHLRWFTLESLRKLIVATNMQGHSIQHLHYHQGKFVHYAVVLIK